MSFDEMIQYKDSRIHRTLGCELRVACSGLKVNR